MDADAAALQPDAPDGGRAEPRVEPPSRFDVFLSHNGRDKPQILDVANQLRRAGLEPWLDAWYCRPGIDFQRDLARGLEASSACAVFIGPNDLGTWTWQELSAAQIRAANSPSFPLIPILLPGLPEGFANTALPLFLRSRTRIDFRDGLENPRELRRLVQTLRGAAPGPGPLVDPAVSPYRGLNAFDEEHAAYFFGRDQDIQQLVDRLRRRRFLAVVGPSGSGKSSLVRAGLLPALRSGDLPGSADWTIRVIKPGHHPVESLAEPVARLMGGDDPVGALRHLQANVAADPASLHLAARLALGRHDRPDQAVGRLVLVVDQLEEAFTQCTSAAEREQFFASLLYAVAVPDGPCLVVVTMRADFFPRLSAYREFADQVGQSLYLVSPIPKDGLREVIERPAALTGIRFEARLAEAILSDVLDRPGSLPLLEHALDQLWQHRDGDTLTHQVYKAIGGIEGAIAQTANALYRSLSDAEQSAARRTLLRLTTPGEGTEDTRRRAPLHELTGSDGGEAVEVVVHRLVEARLLTVSGDLASRESRVDISHEALIRNWPLLRSWLDEDRDALRIQRRLTEAATEWYETDDPDLLYRGTRLAQALDWRGAHEQHLNDRERAFLDASAARAAEEADAEQARLQAELEHARQLAARSLALLDDDVAVALLLGLEARRIVGPDELPEVTEALLAGRAAAPGLMGHIRGHDQRVSRLVFSQDGRTLASASFDGTVRLWDPFTQGARGLPLRGHRGPVVALAIDPATGRPVSADIQGRLIVWDVATGTPLVTFDAEAGAIRALAVAPAGSIAAIGYEHGTIRLVDLTSGAVAATRTEATGTPIRSVAFSPDGRILVSGHEDGSLRRWTLATTDVVETLADARRDPVWSVAFSPDGATVVSAGNDGSIRLWHATSFAERGTPTVAHRAAVAEITFSQDPCGCWPATAPSSRRWRSPPTAPP